MRDDAGFRDAREALDALEVDRQRVRRRVRAASWWFYPANAALVAVIVASPGFEGGVFPAVVAIAVGSPLLTFLFRRQTGMTGRLDGRVGAVVIVAVLLGLAVLWLFLASALAVRFDAETWIPTFAAAAFILMLAGSLLLEVVIECGRRAR